MTHAVLVLPVIPKNTNDLKCSGSFNLKLNSIKIRCTNVVPNAAAQASGIWQYTVVGTLCRQSSTEIELEFASGQSGWLARLGSLISKLGST